MAQKYRLWFDCGMFVKYGQKKGVDKEIQELQALAKKIKEEIRVCQAKKLVTFQRDLLEIEKNEIKQLAESEMQAIYRKQCRSEIEQLQIKIDEFHKQIKNWIKKQNKKQQGKQKIEKYKDEIKQLLKIKRVLLEQQQKRKNIEQKQNKSQQNNNVHQQQQKQQEKQEASTVLEQSAKEQSQMCIKEVKQQKYMQVVSQSKQQQQSKNKVQLSLAELQTSQKLQSNAQVIPRSVTSETKTEIVIQQVNKPDANSSAIVTQGSQMKPVIAKNMHQNQKNNSQMQQNRAQQQQNVTVNQKDQQQSHSAQNSQPKTCQMPSCPPDQQTPLFPSQCPAQQLWSKHIKPKIQNTRDRHKVFSQILLQILTDSNRQRQIKQKLVAIIAQKLVDLKILLRSTDKLVKDNIVEEIKKLGVTELVRKKYG